MSDDEERASARTSEFGRVAAALDEAERIGGERIGGPSAADTRRVHALEAQLANLRPATGTDWWWAYGRLARAVQNGWHGEPLNMLLKLAG